VYLSSERNVSGNGRVYRVEYTVADNRGKSCSGTVDVCVPRAHGRNRMCINDGLYYNALFCEGSAPSGASGSFIEPVGDRLYRLSFSLPEPSPVTVSVFDVMGRLIQKPFDETRPAGESELFWDAAALTRGIYFVRMQTGDTAVGRKVLVR
jgi:hypothetical protein